MKEIERLKESDFPDGESRAALAALEDAVKKRLKLLGKNVENSASETGVFEVSLHDLSLFTPILGFILRSTNIRNAFEARGPILRLARQLLGNDTKLIISSEWQYSPFVHRRIESLTDFVLIGLPAPESHNPLIIPLAGHELGHAVLRTGNPDLSISLMISDRIKAELPRLFDKMRKQDPNFPTTDEFVKSDKFLIIYSSVELQAQETYCDFLGLRLFAESYLHAFYYLISPGKIMSVPSHPSNVKRATNLVKAAGKFGVAVPDLFRSGFMKEKELKDPAMKSSVEIADALLDIFVDEISNLVADFANERAIPQRDEKNVKSIYDTFRKAIAPVSFDHSVVDILNAAWKCEHDLDSWGELARFCQEDKFRILADLTFKSMEVSEFYYRIRNNHDN